MALPIFRGVWSFVGSNINNYNFVADNKVTPHWNWIIPATPMWTTKNPGKCDRCETEASGETQERGERITVNFRNSWGVLVFKVGELCIRLGSVDGHWNWYGGYTDLDNEVEHEIKITINPTGQCLPACPCRTCGLIVVLIYIWYMFPCLVRRCLSAWFLFL